MNSKLAVVAMLKTPDWGSVGSFDIQTSSRQMRDITRRPKKRDFYWGAHSDDLSNAAQNYIARIINYMDGSEEVNPLAAVEMSREQNYNMIDGLHNNEPAPRADLTDGQTFEEIRELAPETLPAEKPSVLEQIKEARDPP